jgi:hypothetical protein
MAHLSLIYLLKIVVFNSYVSLPEGSDRRLGRGNNMMCVYVYAYVYNTVYIYVHLRILNKLTGTTDLILVFEVEHEPR